jgi:exodeoxyribonuclease-3
MSMYLPSEDGMRLDFGSTWKNFWNYITELRKEVPDLIVCGDYNICHKAIIHDPVRLKNTSGFLQKNASGWIVWVESGFVDSFDYSPMSKSIYLVDYRGGSRARNKAGDWITLVPS